MPVASGILNDRGWDPNPTVRGPPYFVTSAPIPVVLPRERVFLERMGYCLSGLAESCRVRDLRSAPA